MSKGLIDLLFFSAALIEAVLIGAASAFLFTLDARFILLSLVVIAWTVPRIKNTYHLKGVAIYLSIFVLSFGVVKTLL